MLQLLRSAWKEWRVDFLKGFANLFPPTQPNLLPCIERFWDFKHCILTKTNFMKSSITLKVLLWLWLLGIATPLLSQNYESKNSSRRLTLSLSAGVPGTANYMASFHLNTSKNNNVPYFNPTFFALFFYDNYISPIGFRNYNDIPIYAKFSYQLGKTDELGFVYHFSDFGFHNDFRDLRLVSHGFLIRYNKIAYENHVFQLYFGFGLGMKYVTYQSSDVYNHNSNYWQDVYYQEAIEATVGFRYFFNKKWGVFGELGMSRSVLQLGVSYQLGRLEY